VKSKISAKDNEIDPRKQNIKTEPASIERSKELIEKSAWEKKVIMAAYPAEFKELKNQALEEMKSKSPGLFNSASKNSPGFIDMSANALAMEKFKVIYPQSIKDLSSEEGYSQQKQQEPEKKIGKQGRNRE
jgi:hypothetical protein